ncbi:MAG: 3-hydroxyacyl-CoA dehydrogenase [Rhodobacterales bacterium]|nr:MAG: 3-hydroxyacyl-CoA dehydrogenase [Rhodobacterales bacterium]
MSDQAVAYEVNGEIAILTVNNPPVNALGLAVRQGLVDGLARAEADDAVKATVIIGGGRTFPAGADIREFGKPPTDPYLPEVCHIIEAAEKPVIAAIHGTALGGGLEVALGAHYRIAAPTAKVGLPEVLLGILPGAGGTQRLPRITGAGPALDMMTSGAPISAKKAETLGIIDRISEGDLLEDALSYARDLVAHGAGPRRTSERSDGFADRDAYLTACKGAVEVLNKKARGLFAPFRIVECVEAAIDAPDFMSGMDVERSKFTECMNTPQREGLIHAFFAERASAKVPENGRAEPRALTSLGIVGGGTMGAGITVAALDAGLPVTMIERDAESIARGQANVEKVYDRLVAKGRMSEEKKAEIMGRYTPSTDYADLGQVDMIIEAVFEDMDVKKTVFAELDKVAKPGAVLASNTSYLNIDEIAQATSRPRDVIGLHFFSPANIMKLLEIVIPSDVADDVVATGFLLAKKMRKIPVRAGNCDGFIGNRMLKTYSTAAAHMMEDGASPYDIDKAIWNFGYPMGIHAVYDLAGMDIGWANRKREAPNRPADERYVEIADRICEQGWFGQKTGRGFYIYENGSRTGTPDPEVLAIIDAERDRKGITPRDFSEEEITRRYFAAMVNEGAKILEEGIALKPSDIDVTLLYGYGFPRYRGGPMKYADMYGLDKLLADLHAFEAEDARFWKPAQLIVDLVEKGETFDDLNKRAG